MRTVDLSGLPEPRRRRRRGEVAPRAEGRAAIYLRVSTDEQAEDASGNGGSLSSQQERCRALCAARGLQVAEVFRDPGAGGGSLDRPGLNALRASVAGGEVAVVVVFAVDRLSRRQADTLALLEEFERHGAGLAAASQSFDTTSATGRAMLGMLAVFAELQRAEIRERTRHALAAKKRRGEAISRTPYGLRRAGKGYETDPASWPVVARILTQRAGGASCEAIAAGLNADAVSTASGTGRWHAPSVSKLCRNPWVRQAAAGAAPPEAGAEAAMRHRPR